jgi:hypothetical protein
MNIVRGRHRSGDGPIFRLSCVAFPVASFVRGSHEQDSFLTARPAANTAPVAASRRRVRSSNSPAAPSRLDDLIDLLDRRRGVVLSSGTTVPGRYESFDLGFSDPPLQLETAGSTFSLQALNARGEVLIAFLGDVLREPCVVITKKARPVSPAISCAAPRRSTKTSAPAAPA